MKLFTMFVVCGILAASACQASDLALGAGIVYFDKSQATAPVLQATYDFTARKKVMALWTKADDTTHLLSGLELAVGDAPFDLGRLYVSVGGGYRWHEFDHRIAEVAFGGGLETLLGIFDTRLGVLSISSGPDFGHENAVYATVSLPTHRESKK